MHYSVIQPTSFKNKPFYVDISDVMLSKKGKIISFYIEVADGPFKWCRTNYSFKYTHNNWQTSKTIKLLSASDGNIGPAEIKVHPANEIEFCFIDDSQQQKHINHYQCNYKIVVVHEKIEYFW